MRRSAKWGVSGLTLSLRSFVLPSLPVRSHAPTGCTRGTRAFVLAARTCGVHARDVPVSAPRAWSGVPPWPSWAFPRESTVLSRRPAPDDTHSDWPDRARQGQRGASQ